MAETNFFELFKATWAQNGTTDRISAAQYGTGWAYIGSLPPSVEQFNAVQQITDQKLTWIYRHLEAVAALTGRELTAPGNDAISYAFQNLNASRLTAGTVPVERLPEKAPAMTVGAAAKWETPRSISISGGAMARAKPLDGSADLALEVTGLSMSTATDVLSPIHGGTGQNWIPPGNYLVGNGTATMTSKTPGQVFNDIGVMDAINSRFVSFGIGTLSAGNGIEDLDDAMRPAGLYYTRNKGPKNWLGDGFLLHRVYGNAGFQLGNVYGSGVLQFRERAQGAWLKPITLANLDSPAFTGAPTAPTPSVEDRGSTRIATVQYIDWRLSAFSRSPSSAQFGATGWWRCGDTGFIRQWGVSRIPYDSEAWVTYGIAFPNMCLGGNATHAERFLVSQDAGVGLIDAGSTAAIVRNGVGGDSRGYLANPADRASLIYWEVWGY
ncbi:gp53-like domain-containing protein [Achromobacter xylosoxidans]|uniref:Putative tail fiber protein gp53-like C-terminal domain-containing protein n=1 Tax=Alcaligenes xylosoxydans xylosoxydans TaxID=85698 RepID=A0A0X8NXE6_ALCXX|nr:hypothetical protein [Achromobacter xylosoxidans]AMG36102.2 hypothetical protein AL504_08725 [Achromobacter xylosoxidans]